jgi:glycosyltransferase involved in cell wall biosynthesis
MKFLQVGGSHPRNEEFMRRASKKFNIEYHHTHSSNFSDSKYDIIWCPGTWVNPDNYPSSKFIFGPQFWIFPNRSQLFFTQSKPEHRSRCIFTCLSMWNLLCYNEFVDMSGSNIPFLPLPFGLDIQETTKDIIDYDCLIYVKRRHPSIVEFAKSVVEANSLRYRVFTYGSYNRDDYMETLRKTRFVIWIGSHESQGFGVQECLATGTPIFVYDVTSMKDEFENGYTYQHHSEKLLATTVPYWDGRCGMVVDSNEEFKNNLQLFISSLHLYRPAEYIKETLTDEVCFKRFLKTLNITL